MPISGNCRWPNSLSVPYTIDHNNNPANKHTTPPPPIAVLPTPTDRTQTTMAEHVTKKHKVVTGTQYEKLAELTTIVADTGEIAQIKKYSPTDATTNPSLLYKAASAPEHQGLVDDALAYGKDLEGVLGRFGCLRQVSCSGGAVIEWMRFACSQSVGGKVQFDFHCFHPHSTRPRCCGGTRV